MTQQKPEKEHLDSQKEFSETGTTHAKKRKRTLRRRRVGPRRPGRLIRTIQSAFLILGGGLVVGALFLWWAARSGQAADFLRDFVHAEIQRRCGLEVRYNNVFIDLLDGKLQADGVRVVRSADVTLEAGFVDVSFSLSTLLVGKVLFKDFKLVAPVLKANLDGPTKVNPLPKCMSMGNGPTVKVQFERMSIQQASVSIQKDQRKLDLQDITFRVSPDDKGLANIDLDIPEGNISYANKLVPINGMSIQALGQEMFPSINNLHVKKISTSLGNIDLSAIGQVTSPSGPFKVSLKSETQLSDILEYLPTANPLEGSGNVDLKLDISSTTFFMFPDIRIYMTLQNAKIGNKDLGDKTVVVLQVKPQGLNIKQIDIFYGENTIKGRGFIRFDSAFTTQFDAQFNKVSLARVLRSTGVEGSYADLIASGHTEVHGTLRPIKLKGPVRVDVGGVNVWHGSSLDPAIRADSKRRMLQTAPVKVEGIWTWKRRQIEFEQVLLRSTRSIARVNSIVHFANPRSLQIDGRFKRLDLNDVGPIASVDLQGQGPASLQMNGLLSKLQAHGELNLSDMSVAGRPFGDASASFRWNGARHLKFEDIDGKLGDTQWEGSLGLNINTPLLIDLKGSISSGSVRDILPIFDLTSRQLGVESSIRGNFKLKGPLTRLSGPIDLRFSSSRFMGTKI